MPVLPMFRLFFRFIVLLIIFAIIRYVITSVARFFSTAANPPAQRQPGPVESGATGGELKQDPVCGTFVATTTSVKKTINGELVHFCSAACRDKFKVAS
jgi:YHS domain-containing protein